MLTALGGSIGTAAQGLEAEVVEVPSLEALDSLPDDAVRGRIVFIDKAAERLKTGAGYGKTVPIRNDGTAHAARKGAAALLIRSVSTTNTRLPHTGGTSEPEGVPPIPAAALAVPDAELLHRVVARGGPVRVSLRLGCQTLPDAESANVVGEVVGREKPEEIVLLGAHLDSWDLGTGALDDGAGVAVVLEAARHLAQTRPHPRRTVRVVLFANEENGLHGGETYARDHAAELVRHFVATEVDAGTGVLHAFSWLADAAGQAAISEIAEPLGALGVAAPQPGRFHGADLTPMRVAGVPMVALEQDATSYFDYHHSADDTFDKIEPEHLEQAAMVIAAFAYGAAETQKELGRIPEDQRARKK